MVLQLHPNNVPLRDDTIGFSRWCFSFNLTTYCLSKFSLFRAPAIPSSSIMGEPAFHYLESAYQLHFYLCFKSHYLRPIFEDQQVQTLLASATDDACKRHGYHLLDSQFSIDHVRLLLSLKPAQTVSKAVQILKGNLSRSFSQAFPDLLAHYGTKSPWAEGYFARSAGKADLAATRQYVERQPAHHGYRGEWVKALTFNNPAFRSPAFRFDHCFCILNYHVVLVTKFRTAVFDEHIGPNLFAYMVAVGKKRGFAIEKMSFGVHPKNETTS